MAVDEMVKLLSSAYNKSANSNLYKLLKVIDSEYTNIEQTINDIKNAHFVDFATSKSLEHIASLFKHKKETKRDG